MNAIKITILFISILTIMAGASVAPVLALLKLHFVEASEFHIKFVIALPAIFIIPTSFFFPLLAKKLNIKQLGILGIVLYLIGGVVGGFMPNLSVLLFFRAILGVGTGILMPLSIGLVFLLLEKNEHSKFMGLQGFFNNLGGMFAMSVSGILGSFDYRFGFLVYLVALIVGILIVFALPNIFFKSQERDFSFQVVKKIALLLLCGFLAMAIFFILPSDFALVASTKHFINERYIGILLAITSFGGMLSGLLFGKLLVFLKNFLPILGGFLYIIAFLILYDFANVYAVVSGIFVIGFTLGIFMPLVVFKVGQKVQKSELSFAMGLISSFIFLGQFGSQFLTNAIKQIFGFSGLNSGFLSGSILSILLILAFLFEIKQKTNYE